MKLSNGPVYHPYSFSKLFFVVCDKFVFAVYILYSSVYLMLFLFYLLLNCKCQGSEITFVIVFGVL